MPLALPGQQASTQSAQGGSTVNFARAAKRHVESGSTYVNAMSAVSTSTLTGTLPAFGWMTGFYVTINATGGANAGTTTAQPDAPWSAIQSFLFQDANSAPIAQFLSGYSWYLAMLYGGYRVFRPDVSTYAFTNVVGGSGGSGNFLMVLPYFAEFGQDGLGCLPNNDAGQLYKYSLVLAASAAVYSAAPTTLPTYNTQFELAARFPVAPTNAQGVPQAQLPPSPGTIGYWSEQVAPTVASQNTIQLNRTGNLIRNQLLVFRTAGGARSETCVPPSIEYDWDTGQRFIANTATLRQISYQLTGIDAPAGVVPILGTADPDMLQGGEYGDEWLETTGASKLILRFTPTTAGSIDIITNDVVPGAGNIYAAPLLEAAS